MQCSSQILGNNYYYIWWWWSLIKIILKSNNSTSGGQATIVWDGILSTQKSRFCLHNKSFSTEKTWWFCLQHSVPIGMKSATWNFLRKLRKIQIHQQTKGLILIFYYQFNQVVVIKSEEITNISSKFNKNTVQTTKCKSIGSNFEDNIKSRKKSGIFSFAEAFWY